MHIVGLELSVKVVFQDFWGIFDRGVLTDLICCIQIVYIVGQETLVDVVFQDFWGIFDQESFGTLDLL